MDGPPDEICGEDQLAVSLCGAQHSATIGKFTGVGNRYSLIGSVYVLALFDVEARLMNCLCFGCRAGALELIANLP
jgi:hypothetical protein